MKAFENRSWQDILANMLVTVAVEPVWAVVR
jgi:hypothetical protein